MMVEVDLFRRIELHIIGFYEHLVTDLNEFMITGRQPLLSERRYQPSFSYSFRLRWYVENLIFSSGPTSLGREE
jgi:hypothetical protein